MLKIRHAQKQFDLFYQGMNGTQGNLNEPRADKGFNDHRTVLRRIAATSRDTREDKMTLH